MRLDGDKFKKHLETRLKLNSNSLENIKGIENLEQEYTWRSVVYKEMLDYLEENALEDVYQDPKLTMQANTWVIYRFVLPKDVQGIIGAKIVMQNPQVQFLKENTDNEFTGDLEQSRVFRNKEEAKAHAETITKLAHATEGKVGEIRIELLVEGEKIKC